MGIQASLCKVIHHISAIAARLHPLLETLRPVVRLESRHWYRPAPSQNANGHLKM